MMDLISGFQIESPNVFVPWSISEAQLESLLEVMERFGPEEHMRIMKV